jgi:hypothetical protein
MYTISNYPPPPHFWRYILVSPLWRIPAPLNFHFEHWFHTRMVLWATLCSLHAGKNSWRLHPQDHVCRGRAVTTAETSFLAYKLPVAVRLQVLSAASMNESLSCSLGVDWRFRGAYWTYDTFVYSDETTRRYMTEGCLSSSYQSQYFSGTWADEGLLYCVSVQTSRCCWEIRKLWGPRSFALL